MTDKDIELSLHESDLIDRLYESISLMGDKITTLNVVLISTNLMQIVEKYPKITGSQKKALVIHVLKKFAVDHLDGDDETALLIFINTFLPSVIDAMISIDKKELAIKIKKGFKICFPCF
jgi:hypothetical protein